MSYTENIGPSGMPPVYIEVLHKEELYRSDSFVKEVLYVTGHHPHLGVLHEGWQGAETIINREFLEYGGEWMVRFKK